MIRVHWLEGVHGRAARPAPFAWNLAKTIVQSLLLYAVLMVLAPTVIYAVEERLGLTGFRFRSTLAEVAGVLLLAGGWLLAEVSAVVMVREGHGTPLPADCPRRLVVAGPYRYVRNPMAIGCLAQGFAIGLWLGSPLVVLYAFAGLVGWNELLRPWEEVDLERRFGEPYRRYRDAVRCWVPSARPYRNADG